MTTTTNTTTTTTTNTRWPDSTEDLFNKTQCMYVMIINTTTTTTTAILLTPCGQAEQKKHQCYPTPTTLLCENFVAASFSISVR